MCVRGPGICKIDEYTCARTFERNFDVDWCSERSRLDGGGDNGHSQSQYCSSEHKSDVCPEESRVPKTR